MKKILHSILGFSLIELMIGAVIASGVVLVGYGVLRSSNQAVNIKIADYEVNHLRNLVISNLSDATGCEKSLAGIQATGPIANLKNKLGIIFLQAPGDYGENKLVHITNMTLTRNAESVKLQVFYDFRAGFDMPGQKTNLSFSVDLFAKFKDTTATSLISSCTLDVAGLIRKAIQLSCTGNDAKYDPPPVGAYGTCTHAVVLKDSANAIRLFDTTTGIATCPPGEYLVEVSTPPLFTNAPTVDGTVTKSGGTMTYKCAAFTSTKCAAGEFLHGFKLAADGITVIPDCVSLSNTNIYGKPSAGSEVLLSAENVAGVFKYVTIPIADITCPINQVLRKYDPTATPKITCAPQVMTETCPAGQYMYDIDSTTYKPLCKPFASTATSCASLNPPQTGYIKAINALGVVTECKPLTIPATCSTGLLAAADVNGNAAATGGCVAGFVNPTPGGCVPTDGSCHDVNGVVDNFCGDGIINISYSLPTNGAPSCIGSAYPTTKACTGLINWTSITVYDCDWTSGCYWGPCGDCDYSGDCNADGWFANITTLQCLAPQDGGWGAWSGCISSWNGWDPATCGPGQMTQNCDNPTPANGGAACPGPTPIQSCSTGMTFYSAWGCPYGGTDMGCGSCDDSYSCDWYYGALVLSDYCN